MKDKSNYVMLPWLVENSSENNQLKMDFSPSLLEEPCREINCLVSREPSFTEIDVIMSDEGWWSSKIQEEKSFDDGQRVIKKTSESDESEPAIRSTGCLSGFFGFKFLGKILRGRKQTAEVSDSNRIELLTVDETKRSISPLIQLTFAMHVLLDRMRSGKVHNLFPIQTSAARRSDSRKSIKSVFSEENKRQAILKTKSGNAVSWKELSSAEILQVLSEFPRGGMFFCESAVVAEELLPISEQFRILGRCEIEYMRMIAEGLADIVEAYVVDKDGGCISKPQNLKSNLSKETHTCVLNRRLYAQKVTSDAFIKSFYPENLSEIVSELRLVPLLFAQCSDRWRLSLKD